MFHARTAREPFVTSDHGCPNSDVTRSVFDNEVARGSIADRFNPFASDQATRNLSPNAAIVTRVDAAASAETVNVLPTTPELSIQAICSVACVGAAAEDSSHATSDSPRPLDASAGAVVNASV